MRRNGEAENQSRLNPVRCGAVERCGHVAMKPLVCEGMNGWSDAANLYRLGRERKPADAPFRDSIRHELGQISSFA
jgi:hypothetical protein